MQVKKNHKTTTGLAEAVETGIVWTWRRWPSLRRGDTLKDCGENVSKPGADPLGVSAGVAQRACHRCILTRGIDTKRKRVTTSVRRLEV